MWFFWRGLVDFLEKVDCIRVGWLGLFMIARPLIEELRLEKLLPPLGTVRWDVVLDNIIGGAPILLCCSS